MARYTLRVDRELLEKFRYVSNYEGRSANSQILILIRDCILAYEEKHGKIQIS